MLQRVQSKSQMIFGTDGMRGRAEEFDISGIERMGYEVAQQLSKNSTYVIGRDTRESGIGFKQALKGGIESAGKGIIVESAGVVPTPLLSYMSAKSGEGGVMITASHNPSHDNGFKFFDEEGHKISKDIEEKLKEAYDNFDLEISPTQSYRRKGTQKSDTLRQEYISNMRKLLEESEFQGKIAIDCANGATSEIAKEIFQPIGGLEFELFANTPDGRNINEDCGVTNPQFLERMLQGGNYQLGISFDGDGDRVGFTDERGNQISGDFVLAYLAEKLKEEGRLNDDSIVITQYSNLALDDYLKKQGIEVHRVENGDKEVMEQLRKNNRSFGGEHSGHIILDPQLGSGDGIRAASEVLRHLDSSIPLSQQLNNLYVPNPQIQQSIPLQERISSLDELPKKAQKEIEKIQKEMHNVDGRASIRPSGTEPKLRVLTESPIPAVNKDAVRRIQETLNF